MTRNKRLNGSEVTVAPPTFRPAGDPQGVTVSVSPRGTGNCPTQPVTQLGILTPQKQNCTHDATCLCFLRASDPPPSFRFLFYNLPPFQPTSCYEQRGSKMIKIHPFYSVSRRKPARLGRLLQEKQLFKKSRAAPVRQSRGQSSRSCVCST